MFLRKSTEGSYSRDGQQHSGRGDYLALFSWNRYHALEEVRRGCPACQGIQAQMEHWRAVEHYDRVNTAAAARHQSGEVWCPAHLHGVGLDGPRYPDGRAKLWAAVRSTSLHQCGHWMMGTLRIGGVSIGVSGSIGHDGLPLDLQKVPPAWRQTLVEVPEDVASQYWTDDGHNTIGRAGPALAAWARGAFPPKRPKGRR